MPLGPCLATFGKEWGDPMVGTTHIFVIVICIYTLIGIHSSFFTVTQSNMFAAPHEI